MCGDYNIDLLKNTKKSEQFKQLLTGFNLKTQFKVPTRLSSGTCIDNIIHNVRGCHGEIVEFAVSDHTAQLLKCPVKRTCLSSYWFCIRRDYSKENVIKFVNCLKNMCFSEVYEENDPIVAFNKFYDDFKLFYDLCFPDIKLKISTKKRPKWMSRGIQVCSKRKRELLWKYRLIPTKHNKDNFKMFSTRFKKIVQLTQKSQNNNFIHLAKNKSKATWQVINKSKDRVPTENIMRINTGNKILTDPFEIAEAFNNFYADQVKPTDTSYRSTLPNECSSMFICPTTPQDIHNIIMNLKNTSSTGYDNICTKILKRVSVYIAPVLSHLINSCILNGTFPDQLKITVIKPLFKKDDVENMTCYRPIALVPVLSKVFEKVVYNAINQYFEKTIYLLINKKVLGKTNLLTWLFTNF
ncbi:uncharacterized protein LOC113507390 [Trichoplusia ni]|uniref:Uncharacterized protein LOC113507390 n=1 Tax=Trichoplusia ni TaxID=7111 RepID=A0A7E5WYV6_TRINI|nr:uncharacterized protein LOC113507390 [Trichoplusia ni]